MVLATVTEYVTDMPFDCNKARRAVAESIPVTLTSVHQTGTPLSVSETAIETRKAVVNFSKPLL